MHMWRSSGGEWGHQAGKNEGGGPSGGVLPSHRIQRGAHRVGTCHLPVAARPEDGCLLSCLCTCGGGSARRVLNTNQMKAVPVGAWEQGVAPRACGWVTLYNYNTVVKAPEPRWRRAGDAGFPSAQPLSALNGLVLFGLELTVVCVFIPPPICSLSVA